MLVTTVDWIRVADKYLFSICFIISSGGEVILENTLVVLNTQEVYQMSQNLLLNENTYFMYCTKTGIVASIGGHSVHYPVENCGGSIVLNYACNFSFSSAKRTIHVLIL